MVVVQLNKDVIAEILSRLCVKDLIRFKSVCKYWLEIISSKDFIKLHLQRSSSRPIRLTWDTMYIDCHRVSTRDHYSSIFRGSSSDGLVCFFDSRQSTIHILNLALHSSCCIPIKKCPPLIPCHWFGLHNDEHKLVLATRQLEMHVIRPYIDSCYNWKPKRKRRDGVEIGIEIGNAWNCDGLGTLFNGRVHWHVVKFGSSLNRRYWAILSFDLHLEKVGEILSPFETCSSMKQYALEICVRLGEVNGCLSAIVSNGEERELWAMKEYGVEESWTKLMVFDYSHRLWVTPRRELALNGPTKIESIVFEKEVYVESLVSPKMRGERSLRSRKKSCLIKY